MATTIPYKNYQRQQRILTVEDLFHKGMQYTDMPLAEGFAKSLVNFDITNAGDSLTPRGGLQVTDSIANAFTAILAKPSNWENKDFIIHHTGGMLVEVGSDAILCKYALIGQVVNSTIGQALDLQRSFLVVEYDGNTYIAQNSSAAIEVTPLAKSVDTAHGVIINKTNEKDGIYTSIDGNTYMPVYQTGTTPRKYLGIIHAVYSTGTITWSMQELVPKEIQPTQAINYGYNMLKTTPYAFTNSVSPSGALLLNGLIPKDGAGQITFTSKVGDYITFELNYQYPQSDLDTAKKYYVQWEIKDLASDIDAVTLQQVRKSPVYTPGDSITLHTAPAFKVFTMIVKVYYKDAVDAIAYTDDATDYNILTPIKVMTLASYYLTADNKVSTQNVTPRTFDLLTATGMCTWQQRLVLWGVQGARSTLFVSEPNAPDYMPYPNNAEILTDSVVTAMPYMGKLLVFTYSSIYMLTMNANGIGYTSKCIQENLVMTDDDAHTIRTVRNMVYFRSGNYYHMIVPHTAAGAGELQLAPVSNPITQLLDGFKAGVEELLEDVYNLKTLLALKDASGDTCTTSIVDYYNYLDGDKMRNVYKFKLDVVNNPNLLNTERIERTLYLDFVLTYDTVLRAWTTYTYQSNKYRMIPYEYNVADSTTFISIIPDATNPVDLDFIKASTIQANDTLRIDTLGAIKLFPNYQMLYTGYRTHMPQLKKRFREVQFSVNNLSKSKLNFYTAFIVDDETRKDMYKYDTIHITDPTDPNYGLIYVERTNTEPNSVYGETIPATSEDDTDKWVLDFSKFPTLTLAKVRVKLTGKGYNGKLKLVSKNEVKYEILTTNWVYRPMYGR